LLPPETDRVWSFLKEQPALAGFVLVGGSALTLRIEHRLSEYLDLAYGEARLPRPRLEALARIGTEQSLDFASLADEVTLQEFLDSGLDLRDYQQNYLINGKVRVSFFAPEAPLAKVLRSPLEPRARIATLTELFKAKSLVSAVRSKTRDWIDLYLLLRQHGFTLRDYREAFQEAGIVTQFEIGLSPLCSGIPQRDDEGYAHLLPNAPTLDEMKNFFISQRDQLEIQLAAEALRSRQGPVADKRVPPE